MEKPNRGQRKPKTFTIKMQARAVLVFCAILLAFVGLAVRVVYLNYKDGDRYTKRVLSQQIYVSTVIPYKRGDILDRKGTILATSEKVYSLIMEPKTILSKEEYYRLPTLTALTTCYDLSMEELNQILVEKPTSQYTVLKKKISYEEKMKFMELAEENRFIKGVWFEIDYQRNYPLKDIASDVIGFTNSGNVGSGGIEGYYGSTLNGVDGREYGYFDSELNLEKIIKNSVNGNNVVATLDADAQRITEKHIAAFMKETGAENVGVIAMNPKNGEILVMASDKGYDLNKPRDLSGYYSKSEISAMDEEERLAALNDIWRNYCISDMFEPGSTWKPMVVAAALEEGIATEDETFECDGKEVILGKRIQCVKRTGHGHLTLEETLINSCNDSLMQIGAKMGRSIFNKEQRLFGLGSKTGIDLSGEAPGQVFPEDRLNPIELATSSFGQGLTTTMIQLAASFSSVVNGGNFYQPHIVKEITNENGSVVETKEAVLVKKTITKATCEYIRKAMYDTVEMGSGKKAKVDGYQIGGKTGTAQKFPREDGNHLVSFIGCVPYDEPELVIYVVVDQPHVDTKLQADSSFATVLAGKIMKDIFPILGIYPSQPISGNGAAADGGISTASPPGTGTDPSGGESSDTGATDGGGTPDGNGDADNAGADDEADSTGADGPDGGAGGTGGPDDSGSEDDGYNGNFIEP